MPRTQKGGPVRERCNAYMTRRFERRREIIAEDPDWKESEESTEFDRETSQKMVEILSDSSFLI
jgi:hypothetical protein